MGPNGLASTLSAAQAIVHIAKAANCRLGVAVSETTDAEATMEVIKPRVQNTARYSMTKTPANSLRGIRLSGKRLPFFLPVRLASDFILYRPVVGERRCAADLHRGLRLLCELLEHFQVTLRHAECLGGE